MNPSNQADFIPEIWANEALNVLEGAMNLGRLVMTNTDISPEQVGNVVNIPKVGILTANKKEVGEDVVLQTPDSDKVQVSLDDHWEVSFVVEDVLTAQANPSVMRSYVEAAMVALAEKMEGLVAKQLTDLAENTPITSGTMDEKILEARALLTTKKAPYAGRNLVTSPYDTNEILELDKFTSADKYGSTRPITEGAFGKIYGFEHFESIYLDSTGSPANYKNVAFHKTAMVLVMRPLKKPLAPGAVATIIEKNGYIIRVVYSYNAMRLGDQVTLDLLMGTAPLRPEMAVTIS